MPLFLEHIQKHYHTPKYLHSTIYSECLSDTSRWNQPKPIRDLLNRCKSWPPVHNYCPQLSRSGYRFTPQIFQSMINRREDETISGSSVHISLSGTITQGLLLCILPHMFFRTGNDHCCHLSKNGVNCRCPSHKGPHHHFCSTKNSQPWPAQVDTLGATHRRVTSFAVPVRDCGIDEGNRICLEHHFFANPSCWESMPPVHKAFFYFM